MCLGAPGLVISVDPERHSAVVECGGRTAVVSTLPLTLPDGAPLAAGSYVHVHTGFAVAVVDPHEARAARRAYEAMG